MNMLDKLKEMLAKSITDSDELTEPQTKAVFLMTEINKAISFIEGYQEGADKDKRNDEEPQMFGGDDAKI